MVNSGIGSHTRFSLNSVSELRCPQLTVKTEVNGDSKSKKERGPSMVGSLGLSYRYMRFLSCLGCSSWRTTKYFFPQHKLFQFMYSIAQQAGQAALLGRLSLKCVSLGLLRTIRYNKHLQAPLRINYTLQIKIQYDVKMIMTEVK
jgi:hypothetical protein